MTTDRRLFLATCAVAASFGSLEISRGEGTSISSLIALHRKAFDAFDEVCARKDALSNDKESAAYKQADEDWHRLVDAESEALTALLAHKAASLDEAKIKARYMMDTLDFEAITDEKLDAFLRSFI
jgi:hypothetical protein